MKKTYRPRRDFAGLRKRREKAWKLFSKGKSQAEVARQLQVSRTSASRWYHLWEQDDHQGLKGTGRAGRKPKLDSKQRKSIDKALRRGAKAHGFETELWTLPRIAKVIEQVTGVHYHPGHVWKLLRSLGWSLQKPTKQARERNEQAIAHWKQKQWPKLKKKPE